MGTRSLITFVDEDEAILTIYRQYDGYLEGRGLELAEFLKDIMVVNGYGADAKGGMHANGMGCLAAQWLASEKHNHFEGALDMDAPRDENGRMGHAPWSPDSCVGNVYVQAPQMWPEVKDVFIEYFYRVELEEGKPVISVCSTSEKEKVLFKGSPERMIMWVKNYYGEDGEVNPDNPFDMGKTVSEEMWE